MPRGVECWPGDLFRPPWQSAAGGPVQPRACRRPTNWDPGPRLSYDGDIMILMSDPTLLTWDITDWTAVTGLATVALFLTAVATAIVALRQLHNERQGRADDLEDARVARHETQRAYVSADFELNPGHDHVIDFVVRNSGQTAAKDVAFEWDIEPVRAVDLHQPFSGVRLLHGIPTLAPGREIRILFDTTIERYNQQELPESYKLTVVYTDVFGAEHRDRFVLDTHLYVGANMVKSNGLHEVGEFLKAISKSPLLGRRPELTIERREDRDAREAAAYDERSAAHRRLVDRLPPARSKEDPGV